MLLDNLKELKKESGMTYEEIAHASKTPESTVKNIFSGKCEPLASTLYRIVKALGGSLDDILADTNIVLSPKTLIEVQENAEVVEAERDLVIAELEMLRAKTTAQEAEIMLLKERLQHKEELLAVYNYFTKIKTIE
jgi:transcriptional regulator with XRE-family HTH domain